MLWGSRYKYMLFTPIFRHKQPDTSADIKPGEGISFAFGMKKFEELRIVFFGTPEFAVASLKAILEAGANVIAVVTAPDKPAGRGKQIQQSAVKQFAEAHNLPVLQPANMKSAEFVEALRELNADLQIVVAFRMMPEVVWNMPPMGTVNVHGSLLPQYRGAAPINRAIINGDTVSGVTTFRLKHEIDTGGILLRKEVPITLEDNAGTMHDKLMEAGAALLVETVKGIANDTIQEVPQAHIPAEQLRHAPKLTKETGSIDWTKGVVSIQNLIRGLSPYPCAHTILKDKSIKVYASHYHSETPSLPPGQWDTDGTSYLRYAASDGWLYIDELQQEGKKRMAIAEFLRGFRP